MDAYQNSPDLPSGAAAHAHDDEDAHEHHESRSDHGDEQAPEVHEEHDYSDEHDHGESHDHPKGLRGVVRQIFAPHSHDAADSLDTALESSDRGIRAVKISFVALLVTSVLQLLVIIASSSIALLADTIHNFSDALTAIPLFIAFRLARRVPTRRYTYGFGRAEDLAGLFIILMITLSSVIAAVEAALRLITPQPVSHLGLVVVAGAIGFVGNEVVAMYRIREGRAIGSAALTADGYHARTDGFTSLAVVVGALGVWAGFQAADPIAGLVISVAILAVLRTAARDVLRRLMNGVDPELVGRLEAAAERVNGVRSVRRVQVRWEGHRLQADVVVAVGETLDVIQAHRLAHDVEHGLLHDIRHLDSASVHVEPDGPEGDAAHEAIYEHQPM